VFLDCNLSYSNEFLHWQVYGMIFWVVEYRTIQAYCCFHCYTAIKKYRPICTDTQQAWCFCVVNDMNPWNSFLYRCTVRYFHGFNHPTTQAYCCFSCCSAITEAVSVTKKITGQSVLIHNKHDVSIELYDINPWNSCLYRCTVRYFMGLIILQHRLTLTPEVAWEGHTHT
jgi:hypothetical protein